MNKIFVGLAISFSLIFLGMVVFTITGLDQKSVPPAVVEGKRVWQKHGCTECHTLFGNGGYNAPDLTLVYRDRGKSWLSRFFAHPPLVRPAKIKRHIALNNLESERIIEFFSFVSKQKSLGWPPETSANIPGGSKQRRD